MHSSPIVVLLTFLLCTSSLGCEFDRSHIPVGDRSDGGGEEPGDRDADADEVDKPSSTAGGASGADGGGTPSQALDGGNVNGGPDATGVDKRMPLPAGTGCPGADCEFLTVCGGEFYSCGLLSSGRSVCWGDNTSGQLGREGTSRAFGYVQTAAQVPLEDVAQLACGTRHVCAVLADHTVRCWGAGDEGQLGRGVVPNDPYASQAVAVPAADQVVAGSDASCARLQDGKVSCWGKNQEGQLARGTKTDEVLQPKVIAQLTGVTSLALRVRTVYAIAGQDRQLLAWGTGRGAGPVPVQNETWSDTVKGVHAVAAGAAHGCFVVGTERRVLCTGWDRFGQSGQGAPGCGDEWCENAMPVRHGAAADGFLAGVDQLVVNGHSSCALLAGQVHCWGANSYGELGIGVANFTEFDESKTLIRTSAEAALPPEGEAAPLSGVYLLGGGYHHFCAARNASELLCWGNGDHGQLGFEIGASPRASSVPGMRLDP